MKIFIDTSPFIYLIEEYPKYVKSARDYITELYVNEDEIITSVVTYAEYGIKPEKKEEYVLIEEFEKLLEMLDIEMFDIEKQHAQKSYQLRAKYNFLKGMDSLQLGVAILENCDKFLTNDYKLDKIEEIEIVLLDSLLEEE